MKATKVLLVGLILICFAVPVRAQIKNYSAQWKKVDELIGKQKLPKSALEEVKKIYAQAKKEKQDAQLIKAVVYMVSLQDENRENAALLSIAEIEKEITNN